MTITCRAAAPPPAHRRHHRLHAPYALAAPPHRHHPPHRRAPSPVPSLPPKRCFAADATLSLPAARLPPLPPRVLLPPLRRVLAMASRGRGRGRGGRGRGGFGGFEHPAKHAEHENFPEINLPPMTCAKASNEEKLLLHSTFKFEEFWKTSCYHLEEDAPKKSTMTELNSYNFFRFADRIVNL